MSYDRDYSHKYYLAHKAKIQRQRKHYYYANREKLLARQNKYNNTTRKARRIAFRSQKPVREKVHTMSPTDTDGTRDIAPKRRSKKSRSKQYGDFMQLVSRDSASEPISEINGGVSKTETEVVLGPLSEEDKG